VPKRFQRGTGDYYKGENNLKKLDTPSYLRRDLNVRKQEDSIEVPEEEEQKNEAQDNIAPFQSRTERIRKDDTDQPAFLRKIMD
jgi:cell division protein FtsZ